MAVQASPQQLQSPIPTDAYIDAPSSRRQYAPKSPSSESYNAVNSLPPSRRPSRRPSANAAQSSNPSTPQQSQYRSPPASQPSSAGTARPLPNPTTRGSPMMSATISSPVYQPAQVDFRPQQENLSNAPIPPPRTSSTQRNGNPQGEITLVDRSIGSREHVKDVHTQSSRNAGEEQENNGLVTYPDPSQYINESRSPRHAPVNKGQSYSSPIAAYRPKSSRDENAQAIATNIQNRSKADAQHSGSQARGNRTGSEVINRVVVTDPAIDVDREQERMREAIPVSKEGSGNATTVSSEAASRGASRSRQDHSASANRKRETKFGEYFLGQTLGEGEFGKVKLGWKQDGSVEVAIKLIKRDNLSANPSRQTKIHREVSILKGLAHPNIVRLHEMVQTERHIGIILEYASGGELFDYILNHRYLKDPAARRLFAQLVSGVGYLHKKGIVHRDLKLENLLLDRNRNIIITDFGFANNFDPRDELGEDIENRLTDKAFVKQMDLDRTYNGIRRGDLMQTSCGSPCYAAPELVVQDSLYTGRKVDVWSCGVILYAMLAGYLPFDDDPANPEGDDIHLLYKYIVSTPLTFPEYVTPHARDLLRRILVPDPRTRADLFEVARHSWLSDFAHVVSHVTSSTTTVGDMGGTPAASIGQDAPPLARSASVREPSKPHAGNMSPTAIGGLSHQGRRDTEASDKSKEKRDPKRRTVQVEYVAPQGHTTRGELSPDLAAVGQRSPADVQNATRNADATQRRDTDPRQGIAQEDYAVPQKSANISFTTRKPLPQEPGQSSKAVTRSEQRSVANQTPMQPPTRPGRDVPRSVSDSTGAFGQLPATSIARPNTGGSMASTGGGRLSSRGNSYSLPLEPTVAVTNAQGSLAQPKNGRPYKISGPIQPDPFASDPTLLGRSGSQHVTTNYAQSQPEQDNRSHKRSTTLGSVFGKSGGLFGSRPQPPAQVPAAQETSRQQQPTEKRYPPTAMRAPIPNDNNSPRMSSDSRRPSFGFGRKSSDISKSEKQDKPRRFSLLPASFSLKSLTGGSKDKDSSSSHSRKQSVNPREPVRVISHQDQAIAQGATPSQSQDNMTYHYDGQRDRTRQISAPQPQQQTPSYRNVTEPLQANVAQYDYRTQQQGPQSSRSVPPPPAQQSFLDSAAPTDSQVSVSQQQRPHYPPGFGSYYDDHQQEASGRPSMQQGRNNNGRGAGVLQKPRKFVDGYDEAHDPGHHAGSTSAAKKVMDFFRRRGKARSGEDR